MRHLFFLLLASFLLLSAKNPNAEGIEFFQGSYTSAKIKAAEEGKLFFLDFTASWCTPCRWMEETTFSDPILAAYVKDNYVALKVDIDDFDGYALKQAYNIQILPSLLIFDSKGTLLAQYEESLSPTKMLGILKKYDLPQNRISNPPNPPRIVHHLPKPDPKPAKASNELSLGSTIMINANTSSTPTVDYTSNRPTAVGKISRNRLVKKDKKLISFPEAQNKETTKPNLHTSTVTTSASNSYVASEVETVTSESFEKPESHLTDLNPYLDSGEGLYRFEVHRQSSSGYSVQVGAFAEYDNVLRQSSLMQQYFDAPVIVHISKNRNHTLYKLMLGEFTNRTDAISFMRTVQAKGIDCMIKNLSVY